MKVIKENNNISIGIDLGITSVGWAVLNLEDDKIIDKGVFLFNEAETAEARRISRSTRRRLKRRKHRIERINRILKEHNIQHTKTTDNNLIDKRIKGLTSKIDMQDIVNIILYRAKHRGYIPFKENDNEKAIENQDEEILRDIKNGNEYPCYIEKEIFKKHGKTRGTNYRILSTEYIRELEEILNTQSKFYNNVTSEFIKNIITILRDKRKFWEGPGGPKENQLTKYGRYRNLEDLRKYRLNNDYRKYLFEDLIGFCNIYSTEKKVPILNYYAEEFNFYNDMLNLRIVRDEINEDYISKLYLYTKIKGEDKYALKIETIEEIKQIVLESDSVSYSSIFKKILGADINMFTGYKKENEKENISKFSGYRYIMKKLKAKLNEEEMEEIKTNIDGYNKMVYFAQISPDESTLYELLKNNLKEVFKDNILKVISEINISSEYNRYHSYSEKALKIFLELMKKHGINSSTVEKKFAKEINSDAREQKIKIYGDENIKEGDLKYIKNSNINDIVASPGTKKALRKAIDVINRLFYRYGYPKYLCIENTKTLLSKTKQEEYESIMLENTRKRNNAKEKLEKDGIEVSENNINRFLLLQESKCKCMYCNTDKVNIYNSHIEHILPVSITSDDSFANKTISCEKCNSEKGNRTPYEYLNSLNIYEEYKSRVLKNKDIPDKKKMNLLFEGNINKYEKVFKNRNLNDTAYATNELANQINIFKDAITRYNLGEVLQTNIIRVPGQFTGIIRDKSNLTKDRNDKIHHAIDAVIISYIPKLKVGRLMNIIQNEKDKFWNETKMTEYRENLFENLYISKIVKEQLYNANRENTRLGQEVNKKNNAQLFNADILKVIEKNGEFYKILQIDNIYETESKTMKKNIDKISDGKTLFLCKENDPTLYNKLINIIKQYKDVKGNPFINYCIENNMTTEEIENKVPFREKKHGIKKDNKDNSAIIKKLRYLEKVSTPFIIEKKTIQKRKDNSKLMYDNVKQYCTRIFKDKETGKLYFIPIQYIFIDKKTGKINTESKYYKKLYREFVGKEEKEIEFYMDVFNNEYIKFEDNKGNKGEGLIQYFHITHNKIIIKDSSINITTNTKVIEKIKYDVLGLYNMNIK